MPKEKKAATDGKKGKAPVKKVPVIDEIAAYGLNVVHIQQFEALGFERQKVIDVMKRLNYGGVNGTKIADDKWLKSSCRGAYLAVPVEGLGYMRRDLPLINILANIPHIPNHGYQTPEVD
ncbi:SubName: Full=Uncharacterized protein {ECO:0000313/EMBL:CCA75984.1} [Serendipita indica DSM 11827]|nr:SubName: Full=Uncharacterized protein {ECO:0000313/EMBL:CCA75984.1} [Serendipita indica DSM 11827]